MCRRPRDWFAAGEGCIKQEEFVCETGRRPTVAQTPQWIRCLAGFVLEFTVLLQLSTLRLLPPQCRL